MGGWVHVSEHQNENVGDRGLSFSDFCMIYRHSPFGVPSVRLGPLNAVLQAFFVRGSRRMLRQADPTVLDARLYGPLKPAN